MITEQWTRRIGEVIKVEAKDTGYADFLATHKEFANILVASSRETKEQAKPMKEDDLFNFFMDQRGIHQFYLVKGDNGTGKSHLIRWIKEKYLQKITGDEESVLFISRAQSTLRGALEQIVEANLFQDEVMTENLKKLINANEHLSSEGLKQRILHHFAIAVQQDEDNHSIRMEARLRKQLYAFLVEQATQSLLLQPGGPIERIQQKLASEAKHEAMTEVTPYFQGMDFKLTYEQASVLKKADISRLAERFVESVAETTLSSEVAAVMAYRDACANYLNQFLDIVVQECTQLRGSDLRNVFMTLRQELKKQGKNLTLFIEDITSFTGIDKELVNVLAFTNEGTEYDESLCRLISVVGVTNEYYKNHFPDNYIDRVTGEWYIDGAALVDKEDVVELTALYLNAIYSEKAILEEWARNGAHPDILPASRLYEEHEWAKVPYRGQSLTIYPFTPNALKVFYDNLGQKTPRRFLTNVIRKYVHETLTKGPRETLPDFSELFSSLKVIPIWNQSDDANLRRQVGGPELNRYLTLLRVWGDSTMTERKGDDGAITIGGLPEQVFRAFGLRFLTGQVNAGSTPSLKVDPILSPKQDPIVKLKPIVNLKQERFAKSLQEIEGWMYGQSLPSYASYLKMMLDFFKSTIRWEEYDILPAYITDYLTPRRAEIDGQIGALNTKESNKLVFSRSELLRGALLAFAAWHDLGNDTWEFDDAHLHVQGLMSWFESEAPRIIEFVRKPTAEAKWQDREWTVICQYFIAGFNGKLKDASTPQAIYMGMSQPYSKIASERETDWNFLSDFINRDYSEFTEEIYVKYFNCVQGDPTKSVSAVFLDATSILRVIEHFKDNDWNLEIYNLPNKENLTWYKASNLLRVFQEKFDSALKVEVSTFDNMMDGLRKLCGPELNQQQIEDTFDGIQEMIVSMKSTHIPFSHDDYSIMNSQIWNLSEFIQNVQRFRNFRNITDKHEIFSLMSQDPRLSIKVYRDVLLKFEKLMDEQYERNSQTYAGLDRTNDGTKEIAKVKGHLEQLRDTLARINQGG